MSFVFSFSTTGYHLALPQLNLHLRGSFQNIKNTIWLSSILIVSQFLVVFYFDHIPFWSSSILDVFSNHNDSSTPQIILAPQLLKSYWLLNSSNNIGSSTPQIILTPQLLKSYWLLNSSNHSILYSSILVIFHFGLIFAKSVKIFPSHFDSKTNFVVFTVYSNAGEKRLKQLNN